MLRKTENCLYILIFLLLLRFVEDILESSISLLSLGNHYFGLSSFNGIISPLHYLALLDPKASWFKKWMVRDLTKI